MPRIIHAADIHLDSPLTGLGRLGDAGLAAELRAATRSAYDNLIQLCIDEDAELLVIAGDIYDGDWRSYETGEYFVRGLRALRDNGTEVALLYGNHDAESSITKRLTMPDGVRVFSTSEPESVDFPDLGIVVHGQGYSQPAVFKNLAQHYPRRHDGRVNIGVLHTGIEGAVGHAHYAPCTVADLIACEYEYFALGHIHERGAPGGAGTPIWFSGNLQGRHPRETGPKGALIVDVEPGGRAEVRFAECDVARWEVLEPDLTDCADIADVKHAMDAEYRAALGQAGDRPLVVRFRLLGQTRAAGAMVADPDRMLAEARSLIRPGGVVEKVIVDVSPPSSSPALDPELARQVTAAAERLAADPDGVRKVLDDLRNQGLWRLTKDTEIDLDDNETLAALVHRAARRLTASLEQ